MRPITVSLPLRVLVVIATPLDLPALDVAQEKAIIQEAVAEWQQQGKVELHFIETATVANINQTMRSFQPHVFHFVGHGTFEADNAAVVLVDDMGRALAVDERTFREFFAGSQSTRLAVLNACQTAAASSTQPLAGLAPRLLQRQLSAVVAMQYPISDGAALIFAREFYRSLALGYGVDAAISEARKGIFMEMPDRSEWGTPVLFLRAKDGQLFAVEAPETASTLQVSPPPEPQQPPEVTGFVGRETELSYYTEQLQQTGMAVITGMAGVGKTALAAMFVRQVATVEKIFWHAFHPKEGLEILIWKLAGFMAWHKQPALWEMLEGARMSGGQLPTLPILLDYACQLLRGQHYLLCLDDFQYIDQDTLLQELAGRIRALRLAGEVQLVITSHRIPDFARDVGIQPLAGMSRIDTVRLLSSRGLQLTDELVNDLYHYTEGNAEFLTIAIAALERAGDPAKLIARLTEESNIEHYLLNELDTSLTEEEREIEGTVAVLGTPSSREAIEETLDTGNVRRPLHSLSERYLLLTHEGEQEREYDQHAILRSFYYEFLGRRQRREMHQRAGNYYEVDGGDDLRAAWHYQQAGEHKLAATLATRDVMAQINQGQLQSLRRLLEGFTESQLEAEQWVQVTLAQGQIYIFQQASESAKTSLQGALDTLATLPDTPVTRGNIARACLYMGKLVRTESRLDALTWAERGLAAIQHDELPTEQAELQLLVGGIHTTLGNYDQALEVLNTVKTVIAPGASQLQISMLMQLGRLHITRGEMMPAQTYTQQALEMSQQLHDHFRVGKLWINLAVIQFYQGDWADAISNYQQALKTAERLGNVADQAQILQNLGSLYVSRGEDEVAFKMIESALHLTRQSGTLDQITLFCHCCLSDLHLRRGEIDLAIDVLHKTTQLATEMQIKPLQPYIYGFWAGAYLAQGGVGTSPGSCDTCA